MVISLMRRAAALITLLALVVGAPYLLWVLGRGLLPDQVPGISQVWDSLTSRDTGALFMGALVLVGFIAWAIFTLCVLVDIAGRVAGRTWTVQIPGFRVPQAAASSLVSAVLAGSVLLGVTGTATAQSLPPLPHAATAVTAAAAVTESVAAPQQTAAVIPTAAPASTTGPQWPVEDGDTLWSIADRTMGDPLRYEEIFELNQNTVQPDGGRLATSDTWLEVGWILRLPTDAKAAAPQPANTPASENTTVTVRPGDTLSQIALDHLDDATRYPELAALNQIADPDDISVGQMIVITEPSIDTATAITPAAAPSSGPPVDDSSAPGPAAAPAPETAGPPTAAPATSPASSAAAIPLQPAAAAAPSTAAPPNPSTPDSTTIPPASPAADSNTVAAEETSAAEATGQHSTVAALSGIAALTAAAAWLALLAARRRGARRRIPGRQAAPARLGAVRAERRLREKAMAADAGWLDASLRSLATTLNTQPAADYPDVLAAFVKPDQLRLQLAGPAPAPPPFTAIGDDWLLSATAELPDSVGDEMAPLPTLASIGSREGQTVLLDLERAGAICLQGDPLACRELMNHLVLELAHNSWSDGLQVTLVGWGSDLTVLNLDRLAHASSIAVVTRDIRARLAETRQSESSLGTDVLTGRVQDIAGDSWMPQVLLIDATDDDEDEILTLQQTLQEMTLAGRATTAVVLSGAPSVGGVAEITVSTDGELRFPELWGSDRLVAARLSDGEIAELAELFAVAEQVDQAVPPATEETSWAQGMDAAGALLNPVDSPDAGVVTTDPLDLQDGPQSVTPPSRVVPIRPISPAAAAQLASVLAADPQLDADLTEWANKEVLRPRISVLGPVEVRGAGIAPPNRVARLSEVVTYLGLHSGGVSPDKFVTDLWPAERQPRPGTRRQLIFDVRKWMGRDPQTGEQFLPNANDGLYRLTARLLDADLLRRLRKRAQAKAAANDPGGALEDYSTALRLVRGRALPEAEGQAYPWLANLDRMEDRRIPAWVTDTAHEAAEIAFGLNDLDTARWASDIGHLSDRDSEVPLCDLLLIAQAAGNVEIAQALAWQILEVNSVTVPEDCAPRTCEIINRVFPAGLRPVSS